MHASWQVPGGLGGEWDSPKKGIGAPATVGGVPEEQSPEGEEDGSISREVLGIGTVTGELFGSTSGGKVLVGTCLEIG